MTDEPVMLADVHRLPLVLDPVSAGRLLGIGRTSTYRLLENGEFPAPALRVGRQWRIPTSGVLRLLGLEPAHVPPSHDAPGGPSVTDDEHGE